MSYEVGDIRNIAVVGHGDSGKTSLVDAIAYFSKVSNRKGSIADGTSISDFEPEEKERKHSLASAIVQIPWQKRVFHFIDCPGYPDFVAEAIAALSVVETALIAIHGVQGITFNTRSIWRRTEEAGVARALVISKIDTEHADYAKVVSQIIELFGDQCVPVLFPDGSEKNFQRVINVLKPPSDLSEQLKDRAQSYYNTLVERVVEADDKLMEKYLEKGEISREDFEKNISRAMARGKLVPIFVVDNVRELGIEETLQFMADYFPSPLNGKQVSAAVPGNKEKVALQPDPAGQLAAYVFKTLTDPYVGKISYFRVYRGTLANDSFFTTAKFPKPEKAHPQSVLGKDHKSVDKLIPGDIGALAKLENLNYGDSMFVEGSPMEFALPEQPKSMAALAVMPKSHGDDQKIGVALHKLEGEDPTFHVRREAVTHELIVEGLSDLHLQTMLQRLKRRFHVEVDTSIPKVPYKEAVTAKSEGHYRHKKQSGGRGQFGEVYLRVEPLERGKGFEFVNDIFGGSIPRSYMPAIEKGIKDTMTKGVIAGYEIIDVKVTVYDGKHHEVDSDEISFKIAGGRAFADAFQKARPHLLEPIYEVDIAIPTRFMGDISGDLNTRRGRIQGMDTDGDIQHIKAHVPIAEMLQYATQLRSITAGEGAFTVSFSHFDIVPNHIQEKIVAAHQATKKEE